MAIQVNMPAITAIDEASEWVYEVKEFLVLHGWTVAGSSNGSAGGMDAVDRIVDATVVDNTDTWVVIQSPHITPSDRVQILFGKSNSVNTAIYMVYCPEADFADNGTSIPTSASTNEEFDFTSGFISGTNRLTMLVDDAAPYGWACISHPLYNITGTVGNGVAFIPLDVAVNADNPGKPYVFYGCSQVAFTEATLTETTSTPATSRCVAQGNNTTESFEASACSIQYVAGGVIFPDGASQNNGDDVSSPVIFQTTDRFYGQTSFMRWTGTPRNHLDTLSQDIILRARIVFGQVTFPWNGTTTPLA